MKVCDETAMKGFTPFEVGVMMTLEEMLKCLRAIEEILTDEHNRVEGE